MKIKYLYLMSFILILVGMVVSGLWVARVGPEGRPPSLTSSVALPGGKMPSSEVVQEIGRLDGLLAGLATPKEKVIGPVQLSVFGYREVQAQPRIRKGQQLRLGGEFRHSVTFAFSGGSKRFCVVDGAYYAEGALLPTGEKILKIMPDKVMFEKRRVRKWVPVGAGKERSIRETKDSGEST